MNVHNFGVKTIAKLECSLASGTWKWACFSQKLSHFHQKNGLPFL